MQWRQGDVHLCVAPRNAIAYRTDLAQILHEEVSFLQGRIWEGAYFVSWRLMYRLSI